jgi:hypothetical protein
MMASQSGGSQAVLGGHRGDDQPELAVVEQRQRAEQRRARPQPEAEQQLLEQEALEQQQRHQQQATTGTISRLGTPPSPMLRKNPTRNRSFSPSSDFASSPDFACGAISTPSNSAPRSPLT